MTNNRGDSLSRISSALYIGRQGQVVR